MIPPLPGEISWSITPISSTSESASTTSSHGNGRIVLNLSIPTFSPFALSLSTVYLSVADSEPAITSALLESSRQYGSTSPHPHPRQVIFSHSAQTSVMTPFELHIAMRCCDLKYIYSSKTTPPTLIGSFGSRMVCVGLYAGRKSSISS